MMTLLSLVNECPFGWKCKFDHVDDAKTNTNAKTIPAKYPSGSSIGLLLSKRKFDGPSSSGRGTNRISDDKTKTQSLLEGDEQRMKELTSTSYAINAKPADPKVAENNRKRKDKLGYIVRHMGQLKASEPEMVDLLKIAESFLAGDKLQAAAQIVHVFPYLDAQSNQSCRKF
jgi:hypothetical protein